MGAPHKRYLGILLAIFGLTLLPVLVLNLILVKRSLDGGSNTRLASDWQQLTQGVVNTPGVLENDRFKSLRLRDRLPEINTVVLGASTTFGIDQSMFPAPLHIYNFSKNGSSLGAAIGEAEYLLNRTEHIKWLVIPLDWSVGFIYEDNPPPLLDLSASPLQEAAKRASWLQMMRDALSYPRVAGLFRLLKNILAAEHGLAAFRQVFLQPSSDEYRCPDGTRAMDFDIQGRGNCSGFRADGSWTYNGMDRVGDVRRLILLATAFNSKYPQNLLKTRGVPNPSYLQRLAALSRLAEKRGGRVILLLPPLLSGMEAAFLQHPKWSPYLATTRQTLLDWAKQEHLVLLDAGRSERFGCTADEFTDEHHATQSCYRKIFSAFWQNDGAANLTTGKTAR